MTQPLPPDAQALAAAHRERQQQLAALATTEAATLWGYVTAAGLVASWALVAPRMLAMVRRAAAAAAHGAQDYVAAAVTTWGAVPDPAGRVAEPVFAQTASDGRPLDTLLATPVAEVRGFLDQGMPGPQALDVGRRHLTRIVATQVADAARVATGVAVVNDRSVRGYVRMLTPPSCSRCVILAGRFYPANAGFARHPLCDCVHIPAAEYLPDAATDPKRYFDSLTEAEQDRVFTNAGARAVRDGADIGQVVNARRAAAGLTPAAGRLTAAAKQLARGGRQRGHLQRTPVLGHDLYVTGEGVTTRGVAGRRLGARETGVKTTGSRYRRARAPRLMPESIYEIAGGDRDEALRLLKRFGYIL